MKQEINILVVEDDNDINQLLCKIIKNSGYLPQPAFSGTEAMMYLGNKKFDLILLDLMLPGMSGEEILKGIGENGFTPVIIISAKGEKETKINSLRAGADDFISKPFDVDEVSARIDSLLRRYQHTSDSSGQNILLYKDISIDLDAKAVYVGEKEIPLTAREYSILVLLVSSPQKVYSKANLFESVWNEPFHGDDNTVNVHMSNLRHKLSNTNPNKEYIETVWGMGYRMKS